MADEALFEEIRAEWNDEALPRIMAGEPDWSDKEMFRPTPPLDEVDWPSPVAIVMQVAQQADISVTAMKSQIREARVVLARQVAIYFLRELKSLSTPQIGRIMNRDHTSIIHSLNHVRQRLRRESDYMRLHDRTLTALLEMT